MSDQIFQKPSDLLPNIAVARHETFHLRDGWLPKGLRALAHDPLALSSVDGHHHLGVGKNMLESIRYWVQATGLAVPAERRVGGRVPLQQTELARLILRHDPFLEDTGSLWLLHLGLASNMGLATFWYWAFNEFSEVQFGEDDLATGFIDYVCSKRHPPPNERSVRKDISVFLRTYRRSRSAANWMIEDALDCPLAVLSLVEDVRGAKPFAFSIGPKSNLALELVAYTTFKYRRQARPRAEFISLDELRWAAHSPGRLLLLDSRALMEAMEGIEARTHGAWLRVSYTAGLRNVYLGDVAPLDALTSYYDGGHDGAD
jgi:hypothetical protein